MGRYREYSQDQLFFGAVDSKKIKESSPSLMLIDWFVEKHVDLRVFEAKLENQDAGAEAINPKLILKVIFYGYTTGVRSLREMEDHLRWDPYFWVLSCQQSIDHSTLSKFIKKYSEEIDGFLLRLYYVLDQTGMVRYEGIATDGTKIQANVSPRRFVGTVEDFQKKSQKLTEEIKKMKQESQKEAEESNRKLQILENSKQKIDRFLENLTQGATDFKETDRIDPVDMDARFVREEESVFMGYNGQIAVDRESHLIIASDVYNEASDSRLMEPMVKQLQEGAAGEKIGQSQMMFDAGYFSSENVIYAEEANLNVYIPEGHGKDGTKESGLQTITSKDCQLAERGQIKLLICPGGQEMEASKASHFGKGKYFYLFRPNSEVCSGCEFKERCYANVKQKKVFKVKKEYMDSCKSREKMRYKLSTPEGKKIYRSRASTVEHVFGTIKEVLHFRRFLFRGLKKVRLIWRIVCAAYNFRRLANLGFLTRIG